jgi:hypothetical protein
VVLKADWGSGQPSELWPDQAVWPSNSPVLGMFSFCCGVIFDVSGPPGTPRGPSFLRAISSSSDLVLGKPFFVSGIAGHLLRLPLQASADLGRILKDIPRPPNLASRDDGRGILVTLANFRLYGARRLLAASRPSLVRSSRLLSGWAGSLCVRGVPDVKVCVHGAPLLEACGRVGEPRRDSHYGRRAPPPSHGRGSLQRVGAQC